MASKTAEPSGDDDSDNGPRTGASFTAMKCPHDTGLKNSCELPFGMVWTPMAVTGDESGEDDSDAMPIIDCGTKALPPVLCLLCLAYINPYVEIDKKTGVWECALCGQDNVLPKNLLRAGSKVMTALNSPIVEYHCEVSKPEPSEEGKKEKGYKYSKYEDEDEEDYCSYILVVDENLSPKDGQAIAPAMEAILKERESDDAFPKTRIGLVVFGKSISIYQLGISGLASADVIGGPEDFYDDDDEFDEEVERRSYIADVQNGDLTSLKNSLSSIFGVSVDETSDSSGFLSLGTSRMAMLSRKKEARLRKEENGTDQKLNGAAKSPWIQSPEESSSSYQTRCTGKALQCALDVANAKSRTARVILFTNGCPNSGDGSVVDPENSMEKSKIKRGKGAAPSIVDTGMLQKAVEFFDAYANEAISEGIGVDVFCCGVTELALPVYQAMVEPSGGYVTPLLSLDTPQLNSNLRFILDKTYMSRSKYLPDDMEGGGAEFIVDIRTDSFVKPTQFCGSGEVLTDIGCDLIETEQAAYDEGTKLALEHGLKIKNLPSEKALELSMTRIQIGRVDPLNTLSVLLEVDDMKSEEDDYAFFQLVSRSISRKGDIEITRVQSMKLEIAEDVNDFLASVDDDAMSVLLAKMAVFRSLHGRDETEDTRDKTTAGDSNTQEELAYDTQVDIDATIQRISGEFRLLDLEKNSKRRGRNKEISQSSFDFAFPPQLKETLNRLYHLRRGPLISPGPMQSMDDRAESRKLFIRFPLEECLEMMRPSLWSTGSIGISSGWDTVQSFPAETLALWDDSIIAADFYDHLFIWSGSNCTAKRYDGIREKFKSHLLDVTKDRFPMPVLHELNDGDSMSRRFTSRLAPSHADPIDNQIANFPLLSTLKPAALDELRSKFKFYDSRSDESFRTWFWSVASASNNSKMEGTSLCE
eukprot:CAMPEP_0116085742 /NCGR_PEP_ID=MMETSP0327-20121206/4484_1 /TAXON_ID=44447 /ORGANISM="Pseudo-nitzschia delicatissima, Strain B596" /LENGTH=926 /DNA_ID=CAMNT_0003576747 /DNA_START=93 /DNA_END=2873 /DNA_ORIENTATION=-